MSSTLQPDLFGRLEPLLSSSRLGPYLKAANGNRKHAMSLYHWNVDLSGAAHESLHMFEIVLRNAMDTQLRVWNSFETNPRDGQPYGRDWIANPAPLLLRLVGEDDLIKAKKRAGTAVKLRPLVHEDYVTQLSLSNWRFLLPDKDPGRQHLWGNCLKSAFPGLAIDKGALTKQVAEILDFRNRVAHLEPLLKGSVTKDRLTSMQLVLRAISAEAELWFTSRQRLTAALKRKP